jgi:mono/diheme cytochrome c family protein
VQARDRRVTIGLVATSLLTLCTLALAGFRDEARPEWRRYQREYQALLNQKATDELGRKLAREYTTELRQVVVPDLNVVDRCVACHNGIDDPRMTDVAQPHCVHPGEYLKWHPSGEFGCTVCHGGLGRATTWHGAQAEEHWDSPLLPVGLTQASCGRCHSAEEVAEQGGEVYAEGQRLFLAKGCQSCHKLDGRGGGNGPALDTEGLKLPGQFSMAHIEGARTPAQWLLEHFEDPQRVAPGSQMKCPQLSVDEADALTVYMLSLGARNLPPRVVTPTKHLATYESRVPRDATGAELYSRYCSVCHDTGEYGRHDKFFARFMPAVRGSTYVQTATPKYVEENIRSGRPGTLMAAFGGTAGGLTEAEIARLREHLLSGPVPAAHRLPAEAAGKLRTARVSGDAAHGATLYAVQCVGCHGAAGEGVQAPALNNPVFQQAATDGFILTTISYGRRDTAMPAFLAPGQGGLTEREVADLVAHVRTLKPTSQGQPGAAVAHAGGGQGSRP